MPTQNPWAWVWAPNVGLCTSLILALISPMQLALFQASCPDLNNYIFKLQSVSLYISKALQIMKFSIYISRQASLT